MIKTATGRKPRNIRSGNRKLIIEQYRNSPDLSVSELAKRIKLSRTTVMKINESLLQEGIIQEAGKRASTEEGGKKPQVYSLNENRNYIVTCHIQYEQVRFRVFNLALKSLFAEIATIRRDAPFPEVLELLADIYKRARTELPRLENDLLAVMLAIHGTVDSENGVCRHSTYFPSWGSGLPIVEKVKETFATEAEVYVDNWIRFKAYAATRESNISNGENLILIDAGWHGLTSGIIINGEPYKGHHFFSGEIGHMILAPEDDELCGCGARGCFESLIRPDRLIRDALEMKGSYPASSLFNDSDSPDSTNLESILKAGDEGDELARLLLDRRILRFSQGLANVCVVFDPDLIILEGDYAAGSAYFREELQKRFQTMTLPRLKKDVEMQFRLTPSSTPKTLEGAAVYAFNSFFLNSND